MAVKDPSSVGHTQTPKTPKAKQGKANSLAVHSQYEQLAKGLAQSGDHRLNALASAFIESRKASVEQFADFVELAETGLIDLKLVENELVKRAESRGQTPDSFRIQSTGFVFDLVGCDVSKMVGGFPAVAAIAGV